VTERRPGLAGRIAARTVNSPLTPLGIVAAVVLGVVSVLTTPREEEPQIIVPMVDVFVPVPGATPAEVEAEVTTGLEHRLWGIPGFEYVSVARRENRGFWTIPAVRSGEVEEPPRIVGFASVEQVPSVEWTVGVEQDLEEAVSPIKSIGWYLFAHVIGVVLTTVLLALYFTSQLEAPVIEEALHLHEEHVPSDYRAAS